MWAGDSAFLLFRSSYVYELRLGRDNGLLTGKVMVKVMVKVKLYAVLTRNSWIGCAITVGPRAVSWMCIGEGGGDAFFVL